MAWIFNPFTGSLDFYDDTTVAVHASTHKSAGDDSIKLDELAAPDDNTNLDFSTSAHGLVPKGTGVGKFLKDDGTWDTPAGGGSGCFVDRGDPASADWTKATLTLDGSYHALDCSSIVPSNAIAILFDVSIDGMIYFNMRKNGNSNLFVIAEIHEQTKAANRGQLLVACDEDQVVEYKGQNITPTTCNVSVAGWFI